jgi:CMP-N-acetylneuraminic acid synthetase
MISGVNRVPHPDRDENTAGDGTMVVVGKMMVRGEGSTMNRKNVRQVGGKPMIFWALKNALDSGVMDEIFVFTEDEEVAKITTALGCSVVERPREMLYYNSGFSNPNEWIQFLDQQIIEKIGSAGDVVVSLNCNICLLKGETLRRMYVRLMEDELAEVIFPVVEIEPHLYMENPMTGYLFPIWDDPGLDRQKFPKLFRRIGVSITHAKRASETILRRKLHHEIPYEESLDLHSETDLIIAEALMKKTL